MKQKIAIPTISNCLCQHFGHCDKFAIFEVENSVVKNEEYLKPPPHEPGVLPAWLASLGVTHILAGGMGHRAVSLFEGNNIKVYTGVEEKPAKILIEEFLGNRLITGANACDH